MAQAKSIIPELVRTHSRITTLRAGCLPERVNDALEETGYDVLKELAGARATTWEEFADKVSTLVGALPHDPLPGWLKRLRESFSDDVVALAALPVCDLVEAAE
jgi:hypothetical protein